MGGFPALARPGVIVAEANTGASGRFMRLQQVLLACAVDLNTRAAWDSRPRNIRAGSHRLAERLESATPENSRSGQTIVGPSLKPPR